ncbi:hypothetical protein [Aeromicrobium sp. 9AM]|uniref:hypothetical protein n=1 Tax=Aeromicrobium sp. 9AM TaxID=2653126 RepID=UPI0012EEE5C4|nr:hypothetical protein [Aeromicrobium sp. 9AM]VXB08730.1 conserved membrane hypothetical protein [Aeromicrobium sp. 9AM]
MTIVARQVLHELSRRKQMLALLALLPVAFYLARHDLPGQSIRLLSLGLGWTISTLALFVTVGAIPVERRLRVAGYSVLQLLGGRVLAVSAVGTLLAAAGFGLVIVDQALARHWALALMFALAVAISVPLGALLGALLRRELEGALALLTILSVQMLANPDGTFAHIMPFWSLRQLAAYVVDDESSAYLTSALVHAGITLSFLGVALCAISAVRMRIHKAERPEASSSLSSTSVG